jgi:predicted transcriptional regulator of viral defense system
LTKLTIAADTRDMRSRIDELMPFAEENEGFVTAAQARSLGIKDSVLARLTQRGKLQRVARGVYRIPYFPSDAWGNTAKQSFGRVLTVGRKK